MRSTDPAPSAAVCRHGCPIKACNLIQTGERYSYLHYIVTEHLLRDAQTSRYIYIDIACRYEAWCNRCVLAG